MVGLIIVLLLIAASLAIAFGPWFKSYRTVIFSYITLAWGAVLPLVSSAQDLFVGLSPLLADVFGYFKTVDWRTIVGAEHAPFVIMGVTVAFLWLRFKTTTKVGG